MSVVEVAIYRLDERQAWNETLIVDTMNHVVAAFPGFLSRTVHRIVPEEEETNTTTAPLMMDFVVWNTLEQANAAAQALNGIPAAKPFLQAMTDIEAFRHFDVVSNFAPHHQDHRHHWLLPFSFMLCTFFLLREAYRLFSPHRHETYTLL